MKDGMAKVDTSTHAQLNSTCSQDMFTCSQLSPGATTVSVGCGETNKKVDFFFGGGGGGRGGGYWGLHILSFCPEFSIYLV